MSLEQSSKQMIVERSSDNNNTETSKLQTFDDLQSINTEENQQLLQTIQDNADGNEYDIQDALVSIYQTKPDQQHIHQLLKSIVLMGPDMITSGQIHDHRLSLQKDLIIQQENEKQETNEQVIKQENEKQVKENEKQEKEQYRSETLRIAKQKADLIQSSTSDIYQEKQALVASQLSIDESQLGESGLAKEDVIKLVTLQRNPDLRDDQTLFANTDDKQELQAYFNDGGWDQVSDLLQIPANPTPIIATIDDLDQPYVSNQIESFSGAHRTDIANRIGDNKEYMQLSTLVMDSLPSIYMRGNDGRLHPDSVTGQHVIQELGVDATQGRDMLQGLYRYQLAHSDQVSDDQQATILQQHGNMITQTQQLIATQYQSTTLDTTDQQISDSYISQIASMFGHMGGDISIDTAAIEYDPQTHEMTIPCTIAGQKLPDPLRISDQLSGPLIYRAADINQVAGYSPDTLIQRGIPTMDTMINDLSIDPMEHNPQQGLQAYTNHITDTITRQQKSVSDQFYQMRIGVQRYASTLQTQLIGKQFAIGVDHLDINETVRDGYTDAAVDRTQLDTTHSDTLSIIDTTIAHASTSEIQTFADTLSRLQEIPGVFDELADTGKLDIDTLSDPRLRNLVDDEIDDPNRSYTLLSHFAQGGRIGSGINIDDLTTFVDYTEYVANTQNDISRTPPPLLTYIQEGHHISTSTRSSYTSSITHFQESKQYKQDIEDLATLDEALNTI